LKILRLVPHLSLMTGEQDRRISRFDAISAVATVMKI
jgi:hypothetical protein